MTLKIYEKSFKIDFWVNLILVIIMIVLICFNFAKIPELNGEGPLSIFIVDILSNFVWLFTSLIGACIYFKQKIILADLHVFTLVLLWSMKFVELVLTICLVKNSTDENVLTFGGKQSTIIGLSVDIVIIIPLVVLACLSRKHLLLIISKS